MPTKSLRFEKSANSNLYRSVNSTDTTWTTSFWMKLVDWGDGFSDYVISINDGSGFVLSSTAGVFGYAPSPSSLVNGTAQYRDPTAWMHICITCDSGTANVYVNGVLSPGLGSISIAFSYKYVSSMRIGSYSASSVYNTTSCYIHDLYFVEGAVVSADNFYETDSTSGVIKPAVYDLSGDGSNSFHLKFEDDSDIGLDSSDNGNDFTPANLSSDDVVLDIPTNNFCTYNVLWPSASGLSEGNLKCTTTARGTFDAMAIASYWEITANTTSVTAGVISAGDSANTVSVSNGSTYGFRLSAAGALDYSTDGASWTSIATGLSGIQFPYATGGTTTANFGQSTQSYSTPSGYDNLTSTNLSATIADPSAYFQTKTFDDGDGAKTFDGNSDLQPDLVWLKSRGSSNSHKLVDSVRGVEIALSSDGTDAEATESDGLTAFGTDGFTVGDNSDYDDGAGMVAWGWKKGATQGFDIVTYDGNDNDANMGGPQSISHGLNVKPDMILIKARLGEAYNDNSDNGDWIVWHSSLASDNHYLHLNTTASVDTTDDSGSFMEKFLDNITSSSFDVGNGGGETSGNYHLMNWDGTAGAWGGSLEKYVAYCWSGVAGYSKAFKFTGTTPYVHLGFRPAWIILKRTDSTGNWLIIDDKREGYNVDNDPLYADTTAIEGTTDLVDITSNGFRVRSYDSNISGTVIGFAMASAPAKYSLAR